MSEGTREARKAELLRFLEGIRRPGGSLEDVGEEESLVEAGLIDSLAVVQIIAHLEESHGVDLSVGGFDPADLRSVGSILDVIERHGTR